jgi:excisionase family DNA binding protein
MTCSPVTSECEVLNVKEAAEFLRVERHVVYSLASQGKLPGKKVGKQWRFLKSRLMTYLTEA